MNISKIISYVMVSALRAVMAVFSLGSFLPLQAHTGVCQIFIKCLIYQINSQYLPGSPFSSVCHDAKNENNPRTQSSSMSRSKVIKLSAYLNISPIYNSTKQRSWFSQSSKVAQYSSQQIILLLYKGNTVVLLALILIFFATMFVLPSRLLVQGSINSVYLTKQISKYVFHTFQFILRYFNGVLVYQRTCKTNMKLLAEQV